jgi:hypothetical protein
MVDEHEKLDYLNSNVQYVIRSSKDQQHLEFKNPDISGVIRYDVATDTFIVDGQTSVSKTITYWAANPLWKNYSYAGSGLPYPNHEVAYENTVNQGTVDVKNGHFSFTLQHPSEYYVEQGKKLLKPHVHLELVDKNKVVTLLIADFLPYRSLRNLPNHPNRTIGR